jgi:hypothetical protein
MIGTARYVDRWSLVTPDATPTLAVRRQPAADKERPRSDRPGSSGERGILSVGGRGCELREVELLLELLERSEADDALRL